MLSEKEGPWSYSPAFGKAFGKAFITQENSVFIRNLEIIIIIII